MKKEKRVKWLSLISIKVPQWVGGVKESHDMYLCAFCKYAEWSGNCCEAELECHHPLDERVDTSFFGDRYVDVWNGADCFLFQNDVPWDIAVEWVGQTLQGLDVSMPREWPTSQLQIKVEV